MTQPCYEVNEDSVSIGRSKSKKEVQELINLLYCSNLDDPPFNAKWTLGFHTASTESCRINPPILQQIKIPFILYCDQNAHEPGTYNLDLPQNNIEDKLTNHEEPEDFVEDSLSIYYENYNKRLLTEIPPDIKWDKVPVLKTHSELFQANSEGDLEEE